MTPEQQAAFTALMLAESQRNQTTETRMLEQLRVLVNAMRGDWFRVRRTKRFRDDAYELVRAAQELMVETTEAYMAEVFDVFNIRVGRRPEFTLPKSLRQGVADVDTWERPARDARVGVILDGLDDFEANERALRRAEEQATMDLQLARRLAEREQWGLSEDVIGYRRVLHPEMSKTGPCGLCIVAATRVYRKKDLRDLHNGCWCTVAPITASLDPGNSVNQDDLGRFYEDGTDRSALQRVRVEVLDHGELGPILVDGRGRVLDEVGVKRRDKGFEPERVVRSQLKAIKRLEDAQAAGRKIDERRLAQHRAWLAKWRTELPADHPARAA